MHMELEKEEKPVVSLGLQDKVDGLKDASDENKITGLTSILEALKDVESGKFSHKTFSQCNIHFLENV